MASRTRSEPVPVNTEPVSDKSKRKLEYGEQRLAPENHRPGTKNLKIAGQRLRQTSLTVQPAVPTRLHETRQYYSMIGPGNEP
jgi:hypothetical protein